MYHIKKYTFGNICPTELEAITDNDLFIYARYRDGVFRYGIGKNMAEAEHVCMSNKPPRVGELHDGCATLEQFKEWAPEFNFENAIEVNLIERSPLATYKFDPHNCSREQYHAIEWTLNLLMHSNRIDDLFGHNIPLLSKWHADNIKALLRVK